MPEPDQSLSGGIESGLLTRALVFTPCTVQLSSCPLMCSLWILKDFPIYTGLVFSVISLTTSSEFCRQVSREFIDSTTSSHSGVGFLDYLRSVCEYAFGAVSLVGR